MPPFPSRADLRCLVLVGLVVLATGGWRHRAGFFAPEPEVDLATYIGAFDLIEAGRSPYENAGYLYPPAFAVAGSAVRRVVGPDGFLFAFRAATLVGVALLVGTSLAGGALGWRAQVAVAVAVTVSPLVTNGVACGNATPILLGSVAILLRLGERWPLVAAAAAGGLNALKPLALPALAIETAAGTKPWRFASAAAAGGIATLLLGFRFLPEMLERASGFPDAFFNLSLVRALHLLGLTLHPAVVFVAATTVGVWAARRFTSDPRERLALGLAASLLALPVIGTSAFLFSLPLQVLALERLARGRRSLDLRSVAEVALVSAVIVSIHGAEGGAAAAGHGDAFHGAVMSIPFVDVVALAIYVVYRSRSEHAGRTAPVVAESRL